MKTTRSTPPPESNWRLPIKEQEGPPSDWFTKQVERARLRGSGSGKYSLAVTEEKDSRGGTT